jgi:sialic acid synthase SpsE
MSTKREISEAVKLIEHDADSLLMHCHSAYPAPDAELSLPLIGKLAEWFDMRVGYSSHSSNPYPAMFAGVLGAEVVECHVTLDRTMEGSDHAASLEEKGLTLLRRELDRIPLVMANSEKRVWDSELPALVKLRGG